MKLARKLKKKAKSVLSNPTLGSGTEIQLANPVVEHFPAFIIGAALEWQLDALADIELHATPERFAEIRAEFEQCKPGHAMQESIKFQAALDAFCHEGKPYVVREDEAKGKHIVICGAGPSLTEHADEYCRDADQVWGCNSALEWLHTHGYPVTHGLTVDQTPQMVNEWANAPDVEYLLATTVHPHLASHLREHKRRRRWFHNFVGVNRPPVRWTNEHGQQCGASYEEWMYLTFFPSTIMVGSGLNAVTRAIDLARYMGAEKITVLGADCSLRIKSRPPSNVGFGSPEHRKWLAEETTMHADGGSAIAGDQSPVTLGCELDDETTDGSVRPGYGRYWETKVDLMISAMWLAKLARKYSDQITLVGDTLPNALRNKSDEFFKTRWLAPGQTDAWFPSNLS